MMSGGGGGTGGSGGEASEPSAATGGVGGARWTRGARMRRTRPAGGRSLRVRRGGAGRGGRRERAGAGAARGGVGGVGGRTQRAPGPDRHVLHAPAAADGKPHLVARVDGAVAPAALRCLVMSSPSTATITSPSRSRPSAGPPSSAPRRCAATAPNWHPRAAVLPLDIRTGPALQVVEPQVRPAVRGPPGGALLRLAGRGGARRRQRRGRGDIVQACLDGLRLGVPSV